MNNEHDVEKLLKMFSMYGGCKHITAIKYKYMSEIYFTHFIYTILFFFKYHNTIIPIRIQYNILTLTYVKICF